MECLQEDDYLAEPISGVEYINKNLNLTKVKMEILCLQIQKLFVQTLERYEQNKFKIDRWLRKEGGGGITCILQNGSTFEKAGVNLSVVFGDLNENMTQYMKSRGKVFEKEAKFFACGISSVIHPKNPYIPTLHFNYRYICVDSINSFCNSGDAQINGFTHEEPICWWFGGGTDLTPYYLNEEDINHFHQTLKNACDHHDTSYYPDFKKQCDEYFFIKHRNEGRGVGGIFFDDLTGPDSEKIYEFIEDCAYSVIPSYIPIVENNIPKNYEEKQKEWQLIRRGRYVEFNLLYDRGTKFGLTTPGARYESIFMSLPLYAKWEYCNEPEPNSPEAKMLEVYKKPRNWI